MRQIVLDTETTGLDPAQGHRVIEIGAVELIDRRLTGNHFQQYLQPDREIDQGAIEVHGITNEFLADKPRFENIAQDFLQFIDGAELVIHNAPFDVGFLNSELTLTSHPAVESRCSVLDTLLMAREMYPGQRNSLDALCKRLDVDSSQRTLHGALLDAEILADVYLRMTGGQVSLSLNSEPEETDDQDGSLRDLGVIKSTPVVFASESEVAEHSAWVDKLKQESGVSLWE
ncbi:MAG: DNA polymerase III subunit epsilon [Pseudomonadota bacterium]